MLLEVGDGAYYSLILQYFNEWERAQMPYMTFENPAELIEGGLRD